MPKVKYLKDLCSGQAGSVHDVQEYEANVLIQLGAAEFFDDSKNKKDPVLLNLNGAPVVVDFGALVLQSSVGKIELVKKARKAK